MAKTCSWNSTRGKCEKRELDEVDTDLDEGGTTAIFRSKVFQRAMTDALKENSSSEILGPTDYCLCLNPIHDIVEATADAIDPGKYKGGQDCFCVTSFNFNNLYDHCVCPKSRNSWEVDVTLNIEITFSLTVTLYPGTDCECWYE